MCFNNLSLGLITTARFSDHPTNWLTEKQKDNPSSHSRLGRWNSWRGPTPIFPTNARRAWPSLVFLSPSSMNSSCHVAYQTPSWKPKTEAFIIAFCFKTPADVWIQGSINHACQLWSMHHVKHKTLNDPAMKICSISEKLARFWAEWAGRCCLSHSKCMMLPAGATFWGSQALCTCKSLHI